jgi:hypothetical protein
MTHSTQLKCGGIEGHDHHGQGCNSASRMAVDKNANRGLIPFRASVAHGGLSSVPYTWHVDLIRPSTKAQNRSARVDQPTGS